LYGNDLRQKPNFLKIGNVYFLGNDGGILINGILKTWRIVVLQSVLK